jgi:hypothetical protein
VIAYILTAVALLWMYFQRNQIVANARIRAIDSILAGDDWEELDATALVGQFGWERPHGWHYMAFDLTKWTFEQFYPELAERERMQLEIEVEDE